MQGLENLLGREKLARFGGTALRRGKITAQGPLSRTSSTMTRVSMIRRGLPKASTCTRTSPTPGVSTGKPSISWRKITMCSNTSGSDRWPLPSLLRPACNPGRIFIRRNPAASWDTAFPAWQGGVTFDYDSASLENSEAF
jgi:hypothetical protein